MTSDDAIVQFEHQTERLLTIYKRMFEQACEANQLTPTQFIALVTIKDLDETRMTQLADRMGLTPGAVSTLVDRLVDNGLVERRHEPADRRAVFVRLTEKGTALLGHAQVCKHQMVRQVMRQLDAATSEALNRSLAELLTLWEAHLAARPPQPDAL